MEISGKNAVVTGATSGIGLAITKKLVEQGATVFGMGRNAEKLQKLHLELGEKFVPVVLDITDATAVESWFETLQTPLHALINNAGIGLYKKLGETSVQDWRDVQSVNVDGLFYVTRFALPHLRKTAGFKHIVSISSVAGLMGNPELTAYNASKFAVRGFSEALMKEVRSEGIKVSCVYPGSVETAFFEKIGMKTSLDILQPEDVADAVLYLLQTPDHVLIDELVIRPLSPRAAK